jgi:chromosome segregation ATPase
MELRYLEELFVKQLTDALESLQGRCEELQNRYDERSENEPEYESQIDRWQEALDRLEEQIDELTALNDDLEGIVDGLDDDDFELTENELNKIIKGYIDFNNTYKGITPILKLFNQSLRLYKQTVWNKS